MLGILVAVDASLLCHKGEYVVSGMEHTCTNLKFLGCPGQIEGCLSEYIILPEENCFKVPENINGEIAALVEPLSIAWYATEFLKDYKNKNNFSAAILGVGPIGLGVMLSLQGKGINDIYITDKLDYRLGIAKNAGAVWTGNPDKVDIVTDLKKLKIEGFDVVIECCGKQEAIDQAVEILKPGGLLLIVGIPENDRISFNISKIRRKEIVIQNVRRQNNATRHVIDLIAAGKLSPGFMITHRFNPEDTAKAFELVNSYDDGVIKAIIKF